MPEREQSSGPLVHGRAELQRLLNVPQRAVDELLATGQLRSFKIGRRRLVSDRTLREFIARREREAR